MEQQIKLNSLEELFEFLVNNIMTEDDEQIDDSNDLINESSSTDNTNYVYNVYKAAMEDSNLSVALSAAVWLMEHADAKSD